MKFLVVLSVALACVAADVKSYGADYAAPILKSEYESYPEGNFQYAYETGNGIAAQAQGVVKNSKGEYPALEITGGYKYAGPDGPVELTYTADEYGFHPQGNHLPVPPAIPELIAKSLAYIAAHPPQPEKVPFQG